MKLSGSEKSQKDYYNSIAKDYDNHYGSEFSLKYRNMILDNFLDEYDLSGYQLLDAMCGGGENSLFFASKVNQVFGIDISDEQCKVYKSNVAAGNVCCASILNSGFKDESFDLIVTESLHHLHPKISETIEEMLRLVKPDGYILFWEPNSGSILDFFRKIWYRLDTKFFEKNEASIDFMRVTKKFSRSMTLEKKVSGGNIAFFLVFSSLHLRVPLAIVSVYAPLLLKLEMYIQKIQPEFLSAWSLVLYKKI